jgi:two-component system cell cycle sensor histidine kinase/response regulator CckA
MQALHVIHVEDSPDDSELVQRMLKDSGIACNVRRVETREQLVEALQAPQCDLILSDCTLPRFHGLEALEVARRARPEVPFVFVSGTIGEETAIQSLQNGATDYVLKQRLRRLVPAVRRALAEAEGRTARHIMEAQLRQSRKLEAIGLSVGGLAHDFRNLLQVLKMGVELMPSMLQDDPKSVLQLTDKMSVTIDCGARMVQELLVFANRAETLLGLLDTTKQIKQLVDSPRIGLPVSVRVHLHLEKDSPEVLADPGQLDRILTNLLLNAKDAMPEGGDIMISSDVIRFDRVPANSWQMKEVPYLRVIVSDTGTGMDEATQARIFEPFFTTKSAGMGTGLGLSVVFGLMEAHNGFIALESKMGEGTSFSLFFPLPEGTADPDRIHLIAPLKLLGQTTQT